MKEENQTSLRILKGFFFVSLFVLIGKFAGAVKEAVIAWKYGTTTLVDSYVLVFNYVSFPISITLSVCSVTLIPLLTKSNGNSRNRFISEFHFYCIIYSILVSVIAYFIIKNFMISGIKSLEIKELCEKTLLTQCFIIPFSCMTAFYSALLMSKEKHVNTFFEVIPSLVIIVFVVYLNEMFDNVLVYSTLIGFIIQYLIMHKTVRKHTNINIGYKLNEVELWKDWCNCIGVVLIGQVIMSTLSIIDQYYASQLDSGSISTLSYANKVTALMLGLVATAINRSTLPVLSDLNVKSSKKIQKYILTKWSLIVLCIGVFFINGVSIYSDEIVSLLFERGNFSNKDVSSVSTVFEILSYQFPFHFVYLFFSTYLVSISAFKEVAICSLLCVSAKLITLNIASMDEITLQSIAFSTVICYAISMFYMVITIYIRIKK